jgi:hypothetical protein
MMGADFKSSFEEMDKPESVKGNGQGQSPAEPINLWDISIRHHCRLDYSRA